MKKSPHIKARIKNIKVMMKEVVRTVIITRRRGERTI